MEKNNAVAFVGLGAILPEAIGAEAFWQNIIAKKYSITDVPAGRWNVSHYFDVDRNAADKTYSKIGAWVHGRQFDPLKAGLAIPPKVLEVMDEAQQWAIAACLQALQDYGYPNRPLNPERVAVILGNAMAGENHYRTSLRISLPEYVEALQAVSDFQGLPADVRASLVEGMRRGIHQRIPAITEDTMPGELANVIAGRVANVFNFGGPNFVTDAACASSLAALQAAVEGLQNHKFDAVLTGGIDRNMGPETFVKFSKIGALSPDGSRPYAKGANGFVMGEGAVIFLMKRLEDAERDGDRILALVRGIGGSSDGKGKGITAPNPVGQQRAIERAWAEAGMSPARAGLIEGHGTSTEVGDVTEVGSMQKVFGLLGMPNHSVVLGSVKSNIGHLKGAAGAAGLLKAVMAINKHILPPSARFDSPNPNIDFEHSPFYVSSEPQPWEQKDGTTRCAAVSSFGFGGTNFHVVLEEYCPGAVQPQSGHITLNRPAESETNAMEKGSQVDITTEVTSTPNFKTESKEAAMKSDAIKQTLLAAVSEKTGYPPDMLDLDLDLEADLGIDTVKQAELFAQIRTLYNIPRRENLQLADYNTLAKIIQFVCDATESRDNDPANDAEAGPQKLVQAENSPATGNQALFKGVLFAAGATKEELKKDLLKKAGLYQSDTAQDSVIPLKEEVLQPERLVVEFTNVAELQKRIGKILPALESDLPATWKALQAQGIHRGRGVPGKLAFLFPGQGSQYVNMLSELRDTEEVVRRTIEEADDVMTPILGRSLSSYLYVAGNAAAIQQAEIDLKNTAITQPAMLTADVAILRLMERFGFRPDIVIGHSLGEYAALVAAGVLTFAEALQVVSARGREMSRITVEDNGSMAAVSAPSEKVEEILKTINGYVVIANINSPLQSVIGGETAAVESAIQAFKEAGFEAVKLPVSHAFHTRIVVPASAPLREVIARMNVKPPQIPVVANVSGEIYPKGREKILDILAKQVASPVQFVKGMQKLYELGARVFVEIGPKRVLNALATDNLKGRNNVTLLATNHPRKGDRNSFHEALCGLYAAGLMGRLQESTPSGIQDGSAEQKTPKDQGELQMASSSGCLPITGSVVISGAGLGLPGKNGHVFDDGNIESLLRGEMRIESIPLENRREMLQKMIVRLIKSEAGAEMEQITDVDRTIRLAGMRGAFDLVEEFGVPEERVDAYDISTQLAFGAGIEALRDARIPLVMHYRRTSKGTFLPDRWKLPLAMQDETGVIFCSAFPGLDRMADEVERFYATRMLQNQFEEVRSIKNLLSSLAPAGMTTLENELTRRMIELENEIQSRNYHLDRRFVFRVLAMGHSQFAEYIGARGPNTHVNVACASTTHAVATAEDWIRAGRCRRVVIIAGDDITNPNLVQWIGASLLASGAATTESELRLAALPFDRRRNGMIMGMGAAALVVESEDAARERGVRGICEILATQIYNSAFHSTRLDIQHVSQVMEQLLTSAELRFGLRREEIAPSTVFISHETYTPARGGSASAEIHALRETFHAHADRLIIANTKGYTGHTMAVGIEDVLAVKTLETGIVPPIPNIGDGFEPDPELGNLNLSKGGVCDPVYALRLGAGFGSQVAMTLLRRIPGEVERVNQKVYDRWLANAAGYRKAELEVVHRTLHIKDEGEPVMEPMRSAWQFGQQPRQWAAKPGQEKPAVQQISLPAERVVSSEPVPTNPVGTAPLSSSENFEEIKSFLLGQTSEKTGYPAEMLDLDLDLEADLGVDTVKQAELFASVRTHYNIPRREDLRLADYNTLAKVIRFIQDGLAANVSDATEKTAPDRSVVEDQGEPKREVEKLEAAAGESAKSSQIKRRMPIPVLRPKLELCIPTGVNLEEGSRVIVVKGHAETGADLVKELKRRNVQVVSLEASDVVEKVDGCAREGKVDGAYFLPALEIDPDWTEHDAWQNAAALRLEALYHLARALPGSAFLVCATRMGGLNGLVNGTNPLGGLVSGFVKALSRERPGMLVKAVDMQADAKPATVTRRLVGETLRDPAIVEVGWEGELRFTPGLIEETLSASDGEPLKEGSVFVVSGGTSGIVSKVLADLALATRGTFFLLSRTRLPEINDKDIEKLRAGRNDLKAEIGERLQKAGAKVTPAIVEAKLAELERGAALINTLQVIEQRGAKACYIQCDVTDSVSVQAAVEQIRGKAEFVDVLIHAAGMEKSRKLADKSLEEFQQVVNVKVHGIHTILNAMERNDRLPGRVVLFSSVAGRFGNVGQTDYSAANDCLSKLAGWLPHRYPGMWCVSIDWGAWGEVGMASRGSIPLLMERAGIELLNPAEAAPLVCRELQFGRVHEVVLAGELGVLEKPLRENSGLDVERADAALREGAPIHTMFSHLTALDLNTGISLEAELDPKEQVYLRDHAMNGIPILPGVMGIEGFAVASKHIASVLASENAGFEVSRLENIQFQAPFKFYRNESRHILWKALAARQDDDLVVRVTLESDMERRNSPKKHMLHFSGLVYLSPNTPKSEIEAVPPCWTKQPSVSAEDIYRLYFHGPTFQVLDSVQRSGDAVLGRLNQKRKPILADDPELFITPLLIELCFQTAGIWEAGTSGLLALPQAIGSLKLFPHKPIDGPVFAVVKPVERDGRTVFDARVVDAKGYVYLELSDYSTIPLPYPAESGLTEPMKILAGLKRS